MNTPDIWTSGRVTRWHTHPVMNVHFQSNADHQWGVAALCLQLNPHAAPALIYACLHHDSGEIGAADVPYPNGKAHPELKAASVAAEAATRAKMGVRGFHMTDSDWEWLHMCDRLESVRFVGLRARWLLSTAPWVDLICALMRTAESLGAADKVLEALAG